MKMDSNMTSSGSMTPMDKFVFQKYRYVFYDEADINTERFFLLGSPVPIFSLCFGYVVLCCIIGPKLMIGKNPLDLRKFIQYYNCGQVIFNVWILSMLIRGGWFTGYNFHCQSVGRDNDPQSVMMAHAIWWFFISKLADFLDTIFFVLRKNYRQISILHIWHHAAMPFGCWYAAKFIPGGQVTFVALLNSFVHVIMYSYYFLASLGPTVQKYLWWKKYLTMMQMVQFALIVIHHSQLFFINCDFPAYPRYWALFLAPLMFVLFFFFYMESYQASKSVSIKLTNRKGSFQSAVSAMTQCYNVSAMEVEDKNKKNSFNCNNSHSNTIWE